MFFGQPPDIAIMLINTPAEKLIEYIKFVVDFVYILSVGNRIYKQAVGIQWVQIVLLH